MEEVTTDFRAKLAETLAAYLKRWQDLTAKCQNQRAFSSLKPTAVGWKVTDRAELQELAASLQDQSLQIHCGWVNERWLATFYLKEPLENTNVQMVKLMERRPESTDATGLDHVDFLAPEDMAQTLAKEPSLSWSEERNGEHCKWLSVWFDGTEAKLRTDTVLQVCADEMLQFQKELLESL